MTIIGFILLALALLMTVLYIPIAATIRPVAGPDGMGLISVLFLGAARVVSLAAALLIGAARGGFSWIHPNRGVQALAVIGALAVTAAMELWSVVAATSWYGRSGRLWVAAFAVVAPLLLTLLGAAALDRGRTAAAIGAPAFRGAAMALIVLTAAGTVVLGLKHRAVAAERRAHVAAVEAENQRVYDERLSAFRALGAESPLRSWLAYTADSADEIRETAVESIRARPELNRELAEILRSDDPLPALRWLWLWSHDRPEELGHALHDAASGLPAWARRRYEDADPENDADVGTACEALVVVADEFGSAAPDFRPPIEAMAAYLDSLALPEEQMSYDKTHHARSMLQYWLTKHAVAAAGPGPAAR